MIKINISRKLYDKWLVALRSGKYKQGRFALFNSKYDDKEESGYCCMGVLGAVSKQLSKKKMKHVATLDALWPPKDWLGRYGVDCHPDTAATKLAQMSDAPFWPLLPDTRKSFPEIADWIEANLEPFPVGKKKHGA